MDDIEGTSHTGFRAGSFSVSDETRTVPASTAGRQVRIVSASFEASLPLHTPVAAPAARLALRTDGLSRGLLDGAWWPRSRDLLHELPSLTDLLDPLWGRVTRVAVNPELWPVVPRQVSVHGRIVKVGWFTQEIDPHKLLLLSRDTGRWDLLVIPPETDAASAARMMTAASDDDRPLTASALVAAERARPGVPAADRRLDPDETWEYEGGASSASSAVPRPPRPWSSSPRGSA